MPTAAQIAEQKEAERRAAEASAEAKAKREAELAQQLSRFFSFNDITWLAARLQRILAEEPALSTGDVNLQPLTEAWLQHRYPNRLQSSDFDLAAFEQAVGGTGTDVNQPVCFLELVQLMYFYMEAHLENEPMAGFSDSSFKRVQAKFGVYDKDGKGLKTRELWEALHDCGATMTNLEDQQWMVHMVKIVDKNADGLIDVGEFCQLLRKVRCKDEQKLHARENRLIMQSKIPLREVEEWALLFRRYDHSRQNKLSLLQLHQLCSSIGIKWTNDGTDTLKLWMRESGAKADDQLDFGEFCCLIQKLVAEDFCGIRSATSSANKGGEASLSGHPGGIVRWSEQKNIRLIWNITCHEPCSPTMAPREAMDWNDDGTTSDSAGDRDSVVVMLEALRVRTLG